MKIGILWDLDGTLLDTLQDLADAVNQTLQQRGYPCRSVEEIRAFVGNGAYRLMRQAVPKSADEAAVQESLTAFRAYYKKNAAHHTCPYAGVTEVLQALGKTYPMAVVSNKPDEAVKALCAMYFPGVFALGERPDCPRKPAPDMVRKAMAALGVDRCVYVGDSEVDVLTARNAAVPCLSVLWGFRDQDVLAEAGATHLCRDPSQIPQCIEKIIKEQF